MLEQETAQNSAEPTRAAMAIETHTHTKKGFLMHLCILTDRVDGATFAAYRAQAESFGGWYSRAWGSTPGGFAFKDRTAAESFMAGSLSAAIATASRNPAKSTPAPVPRVSPATKLRALADAMQSAIDDKFRDRLENTPKRARQGGQARNEGQHLKRTQAALRALASAHEAGTLPPILAPIVSKATVHELTRTKVTHHGGYYDPGHDTGEPYSTTPESVALWQIMGDSAKVDRAAVALREALAKVQFANIEGYFPTPASIVARMLERADISDGQLILEPEAGSGNIADAIKAEAPGAELHCFEIDSRLAHILALKGHKLAGTDFETAPAYALFDRVVMNPPFEHGQDMAHVRKAFDWLKPGGRLVAIMSPGPFFRQDRKAQEFRAWFESLGGESENLDAGAFKASGTNVATVLVEIRKD